MPVEQMRERLVLIVWSSQMSCPCGFTAVGGQCVHGILTARASLALPLHTTLRGARSIPVLAAAMAAPTW